MKNAEKSEIGKYETRIVKKKLLLATPCIKNC